MPSRTSDNVGRVSDPKEVDSTVEYAYLQRLPVAVRRYLVEDAWMDWSAVDVFMVLGQLDGDTGQLLRLLHVEEMNEANFARAADNREHGMTLPPIRRWSPVRREQRSSFRSGLRSR